jgi:hypothetical protein
MCWTWHYSGWDEHRKALLLGPSPSPIGVTCPERNGITADGRQDRARWALGQECCFIAVAISLLIGKGETAGRRKRHGAPNREPPEIRVQTRVLNHCAQCGETMFLPEWSEYMDRQRVRHLWECEACGYKFETLVSFPDP